MRLLISFAALFLSVVFLQLGSGGIAPLDAISALELNFSRTEIGLLGSAHFSGFFIGCWWAPRLMGAVGHSRSFAAFTALGTMGILSHMLIIDPIAWAGMRVMSGLSPNPPQPASSNTSKTKGMIVFCFNMRTNVAD